MYRKEIEELKAWKVSPNRKPLIIKGARQVGKTWLIKEFGKMAYEQVAYINFESSPFIYCEKFQPELAIHSSLSDYRQESWMVNLPLYAIETALGDSI
jgi:predicted AAA+ superfamily ATPase